jgi:4-amino-4-deoxy-L-arabinose transferase-like glycosyltransferase
MLGVRMNNKFILGLIVAVLLASSIGMFFPLLTSNYSPYYGSIAKHIFLTDNWVDLSLSGKDWLDKPHLPFWLTAISFKIFGVNSFAYILPGFLFNILGAIYTYKVANIWYDKKTSLLAVLFYFSCLHLMLSSIDVRAEAYLVGEIMPACYYLLLYEQKSRIKYLFLAAFFSALAMMTKGVFVLVTICSGLIGLWIYHRKWRNFISVKWLCVIALAFIFVAPEVVSLYLQFNLHPEKIIFGTHGFSGIRWFFWDSQFGRFFNTGPIMTTNPMPYHWLFFVHTFLWAFLPWWPMFFAALWCMLKRFLVSKKLPDADVYLLASFFVTFVLFSATSFQVDHYTNIIFPFASIICAKWMNDLFILKGTDRGIRNIYFIEIFISLVVLFVVLFGGFVVLHGIVRYLSVCLALISGGFFVILSKHSRQLKTVVFPTIAMAVFFVFAMCVNGIEYAKYDAGYQIALNLNQEKSLEVIGYKIELMSLDLYSKNSYRLVNNLGDIGGIRNGFYLVTAQNILPEVMDKFPNSQLINNIYGCKIETFLANMLHPDKLQQNLDKYVVIRVYN